MRDLYSNRGALAFAAAFALASAGSTMAFAQTADQNYQAQVQDYQAQQQQYQDQKQAYDQKQQTYDAQKDAYAAQRAGYRERQDVYAEQRRLYALGRAEYDARFGVGAFDEYTRTHTTTTTVVSPAGNVESRTKTTVIEHGE